MKTKLDADQWKFAKSVFQAAIELSTEQRESFVVTRCGSDLTVREQVLKLIERHSDSSAFLQSPLNGVSERAEEAVFPFNSLDPESLHGHCLEDFEIVRRIGSGGMGTVFEARQQHPSRAVAIKILNLSCSLTAKSRLRFEHEAEILARLDHPGIAKVHAAGWHDFGLGREQPWFAMELIDGIRLDDFSRQNLKWSNQQKLHVFLSICDAVQHAHSRGVIHRDLKPANILITDIADKADSDFVFQPKIVDFGVARIETDRRATLQTVAGELMGTLNYMCPEQVSADPSDIDHRCDVYALGVIGFELLSGRLPHDRTGVSLAASLRMIEQGATTLLGQVNPSCRGDLEIIFAKALSRDPAVRWDSVQSFADDLRRYLDNQPIQARPASPVYRTWKFITRHLVLVVATAIVFSMMTAGIIMYAGQAREARAAAEQLRYEADKAKAINNFMSNDFLTNLLTAAGRTESNQPLPAKELVRQSAENISSMFADRPTIEAAVRNEIGTVYYNLNQFKNAADEYEKALQLWESSLGADHSDTLKAVNNLGQSLLCNGQRESAEQMFRRALEGRIQVLGEADAFTLVTMNNLAHLLRRKGNLVEAETLFRRALDLQKKTIGLRDKDTLTTMNNLGNLLRQQDKIDEALELHGQVFRVGRSLFGEDHIFTLQSGSSYAQTLYCAEQYESAVEVLLPILQSVGQVVGPDNRSSISARRLLGRIYRGQGLTDLAQQQFESALNGLRQSENPDRSLIEKLIRDLSNLKIAKGKSSAAEK